MPTFASGAGLLVAAPPTLLRHGLLLTLRETWPDVPLSALPGAEGLLRQLCGGGYGLLVLDSAGLPAAGLPALLGQVRQQCPRLPVLVLVGRRPPGPLPGSAPLRLLARHATPAQVAAAAAELLLATAPLPRPPRPPGRPAQAAFSPRELEVLALVLDDLPNEQIAARLYLSVRTVESHRRALLHKAGVRSPVGLAVRALREGWVAA